MQNNERGIERLKRELTEEVKDLLTDELISHKNFMTKNNLVSEVIDTEIERRNLQNDERLI